MSSIFRFWTPAVHAEVGISQSISLSFEELLAESFEPSLTYNYDVDPGLASTIAVTFDPSFILGEVAISPDLVDFSAVAISPELAASYLLAIGVVDQTSVAFDLVISSSTPEQFIEPGLSQQLVVVFSPQISDQSYIVMIPASSLAQAFGLKIEGGERGGKMMLLKDQST